MPLAPTHVSFRAVFPKDHSPTHPAGRELADVLEGALGSQRVKVCERGQTDYSHTFVLECGGRRFSAMLGVVDDPDGEWLFFFQPSGVTFFLESLSARQRLALAKAVHTILESDGRIDDIRWYRDAKAWNAPVRNQAMASPEA